MRRRTNQTAMLLRRCAARPIEIGRVTQRRLIGTLVVVLLAGCNRPPEHFTIALPDVTFVVDWDWVPAHVRAQATTSFDLRIPYWQTPAKAVALDRAIRTVEHGFIQVTSYHMTVEYRPTPVPGGMFAELARTPGWTFMPDDPASDYRVAVRGPSKHSNAEREEVYEWKKDSRYVVKCGYMRPGGDPAKALFGRCVMNVPYREFAGEKCTQLAIGFTVRDLHLWPVIAQTQRELLRTYESQTMKKEG